MDPITDSPEPSTPDLVQPAEQIIAPTQVAPISPIETPQVADTPPIPPPNDLGPTAASPMVTPESSAATPAAPSLVPEATSVAPVAPTLADTQPVSPESFSAPTIASPIVSPAPIGAVMGGSVSSALRSGKRWLKPLLVAAAAVVILGGSSAAAYYGVVVPNKPTNVLKTALLNSLQQKQVSFKGTLDASSAGTAYKVDLTGAADATTKASDVQLNLTVSGINFAVEARLVDQNLYLKVGDLSTLTTLLGTYSPDLATSAQSLSNAVSNKWVEVDSTLLNEASASCALNTNWSLTNNDAQLLTDQYSKDPFATVQSSTSDTVGGKKVEKFVLSVDDDKLAAYAKNLKGLSLFKTLENCEKGSNPADSFTGDHDHTPLTIWVDKSTKQVVQLASNSTAQDAKTYDIKASGTITLTYGKVNIVAPTGAEPALQIISQIEQSFQASGFDLTSLLSGLLGSAGGAGSSAADSERQADISTLQAQLEAFFALNNYYPSLSDLNSSTWLAANMKDLDKSALADPSNSSSMKLVANPTAKSYAYTVTTDTGNSCESNETTCTMYTLTATLSDGTTFVKQSLN